MGDSFLFTEKSARVCDYISNSLQPKHILLFEWMLRETNTRTAYSAVSIKYTAV